jgi:hypothetical protein
MQFLTLARSAEVVGERTNLKKSQQGEKLSDAILDRSAGEAPLVCTLKRETSLRDTSVTRFDAVCLVKDKPMVVDGVKWRRFFDDVFPTTPTLDLLAV